MYVPRYIIVLILGAWLCLAARTRPARVHASGGAADAAEEYEYQPDPSENGPWVIMYRPRLGGYVVGRIDVAGDFEESLDKPPWPVYNLPQKGDTEQVYEYRSGTLTKGLLAGDGEFRPAGDKVIAFKDYRYSKKAIRIYNLPGKFVAKKAKAKP